MSIRSIYSKNLNSNFIQQIESMRIFAFIFSFSLNTLFVVRVVVVGFLGDLYIGMVAGGKDLKTRKIRKIMTN